MTPTRSVNGSGRRVTRPNSPSRGALAQYLPPPPARVLDCGGGPGRYAIELAQQGYEVALFDPSPVNLALAREHAAQAGVTLAAFEQGTATDLSRFADDSFDAVLLMGPLYHLLTEAERRQAVAEARRVLKPGGPLFAAFIARYAAHSDAATKFLLEPVERPGLYERIEETGLLPPGENEGFAAYFARAEEAAALCWDAGLEVHALLNVEGIVAGKEHYGLNQLTGAAWAWWEDLNWRLAAEPSLLAAAQHYLVVSIARWAPAAGGHRPAVPRQAFACRGRRDRACTPRAAHSREGYRPRP